MNNFDLKKYLAEGRLLNEEKNMGNNPSIRENEDSSDFRQIFKIEYYEKALQDALYAESGKDSEVSLSDWTNLNQERKEILTIGGAVVVSNINGVRSEETIGDISLINNGKGWRLAY